MNAIGNLGAARSPVVIGWLATHFSWHSTMLAQTKLSSLTNALGEHFGLPQGLLRAITTPPPISARGVLWACVCFALPTAPRNWLRLCVRRLKVLG
jgi:hypothetical protein